MNDEIPAGFTLRHKLPLQGQEGHKDAITQIAWSPDPHRQRRASGSYDRTIRIWNAGMEQQPKVLQGHTQWVTCVSFSSDSRFLVSKSSDNTVRLWRCDIWETVEVLDEATLFYWFRSLAFHPHPKALLSLLRSVWRTGRRTGLSVSGIWTSLAGWV